MWCASRRPPLGVRLFLSLFAVSLRFSLQPSCHLAVSPFSSCSPLSFLPLTKNWHGLQMQRLSVVLHTAVAWQTVNELACGESGIVHGAECIAVLNGVA